MEQFLLSEQIPDKWTVNKAGKLFGSASCWRGTGFFGWHSLHTSCRGANSTDTTAHILTAHTPGSTCDMLKESRDGWRKTCSPAHKGKPKKSTT